MVSMRSGSEHAVQFCGRDTQGIRAGYANCAHPANGHRWWLATVFLPVTFQGAATSSLGNTGYVARSFDAGLASILSLVPVS